MFNGSKQTFGATGATGFGYNNATTPSPFGAQPAFGKPANAGFGQPSAFGQSASLFGTTQPTTSLFGSNAPTPAFGAPATTPGFGGTLGGFGQQQQQQQVPQQQAALYGIMAKPLTQITSLFGQPSASAFGAAKPTGFGFGAAQTPTSLFGQASTVTTAGTGFGGFGATTAPSGSNLFGVTGTTGFGQGQPGANGTAICKYQPSLGSDTLVKNGQSTNVSTKQHCITAMKEYENKCLEELRMEDYMANRKGAQPGSTPGGVQMFGAAPASAGLFGASAGAQPPTSLFGQPNQSATNTMGGFGQPTNTMSGFGQPAQGFGQPNNPQASGGLFNKTFTAPATSAAPFGGFSAAPANSNLFGTKPFGQPTTGLFGQPATSTASAFGQQASGFGSFGQPTANQPSSLFGNPATSNPSGFGLPSSAPNNTFGFGNPNTSTVGGGLFGQKPVTGFGTTPAFGTQTSNATTGFSTFGQPNQPGSLFNNSFNKAPAQAFGGFGTQAAAPTLGLGMGTGNTSLFGNTAAKPGGLFGNSMTSAPGGLFGSTFGANNTLGVMNQNTMGMGSMIGGNPQGTVPIHQQILSLATSPYGDNAIFKDLKPLNSLSEDALKPTNPAAQKAILESSSNQFKISPRVGNTLKVKPITLTKKSLFGGLEEFDSSVEESFNVKPNVKRLIIKAKKPQIQNASISTTIINTNDNSNAVDNQMSTNMNTTAADEQESFRNNIPQSPLIPKPDDENTRRVSWLRSNPVDKATRQNRNIEYGLDNTIQELVTGHENVAKDTAPLTEKTAAMATFNRKPIKSTPFSAAHTSGDSLSTSQSFLDDTNADLSLINTEVHSAGVVLQRSGYYTIPPLDKLPEFLSEDGTCKVPNLTIGRRGYGNVYFDTEIDVAGLNLDELVHFRHKEVIIYPDDENKPPVGSGLNQKAQITLDQIWPNDKTLREPIKDKQRLEAMDYEGKLRRVCDKHDMRFMDYRPETGSWVFKVDHFSKYGLSDSDEEDIAAEAKKAKLAAIINNKNQQSVSATEISTLIPTPVAATESSVLDQRQQGLGGFDARYEPNVMDFASSTMNQSGFSALSPSAAVAFDMGTDSHKLQLMKASLFVDDDFDCKSVASEQLDRDSPDQIVPNKPYLRHHLTAYSSSSHTSKGMAVSSLSSKSDMPVQVLGMPLNTVRSDVEVLKPQKCVGPKSRALIVKPKVALVKIPRTLIPLANSIISKINGKCASDLAFMYGRKFKVGWGPQNKLFMLQSFENSQKLQLQEYNMENLSQLFNGRNNNDCSRPIVVNMKISSTKQILAFQESIENHLLAQLKFTKCETRNIVGDECPHFISTSGPQIFSEHYMICKNNAKLSDFEMQSATVWVLCKALWGNQEELDGHEINSHLPVTRRKELLSEWLEMVITERDVMNRNHISKSGYFDHLLSLVMSHKVTEACELAFNNNDINLSFLLAQLSSGPTVRQLMKHQLSTWQDVEADQFVAVERIKACMLVAGVPLVTSSHGAINIFEDLDWLKAFALHVWYLSSATSSITDALLAYDQSFKSDEFHAMAPNPLYGGSYQPSRSTPVEDVHYHLLKLFSKRSHPMESLLNPATHTSDQMDFRLSWLLLEGLEAIGYHHCSDLSKSQLHVSFASQLENHGLWHWSIFVLLHINNSTQRESAIQNILYKYVMVAEDDCEDDDYAEKESFVVTELNIPKKWIYWAKAVRSGVQNKYHVQADYLLRAGQWALAHDVIMMHIAPDAIINDNIQYVHRLLNRFEDPKQIPNWSNQGSVLLDYIEISEKFENLKTIHEEDIETSWEQLKPQLSELCSRINLYPCPTAKHRLCQSEIAQRLANLVSGIRILCPDLNSCVLMKVILEKLPLPQEYAKQKFRALLEDSRLVGEMVQANCEH